MIETPEIPLETMKRDREPRAERDAYAYPNGYARAVTTVGEGRHVQHRSVLRHPLEALKTTNPNVNPNAMGVGTVLQIP